MVRVGGLQLERQGSLDALARIVRTKRISTEPGIVISFFTNVEVTTSTCVPLSVGVLVTSLHSTQSLPGTGAVERLYDTPKGKRTEGVGSVAYSLLARQRGQ